MLGALNSDLSEIIKYIAIFSLPLLILSSCYMFKFLHKSFMGEIEHEYEKINDISVHEFVVLASILAGLVLFGLYPNILLNMAIGG